MAQWHYADRDRQQHGPVDDDALVRLFRSGAIGLDSLVWRPDLTQWQALAGFADQLGLQDTATPYAPPTAEVLGEDVIVSGGEVVYAGFWKRVAAYFIDSVIAGLVAGVIGGIIGATLGVAALGSGGAGAGSTQFVIVQLISNLVGIVIGVAYFAGFHASASMATLGKMAVGIKVVRSNGERISFLRGVGRYFALFVSTLTLCIGFLMAGFTERKRALHDMLCDTLVVDKWAYTQHPEWQRRELGAVTVVILVVFGLMAVLAMFAIIAAITLATGVGH